MAPCRRSAAMLASITALTAASLTGLPPLTRHTPIRLPRNAFGFSDLRVVAAARTGRPRSVAGSRAVDALDHREHGRRVGHRPRHRPGRVLLRRDGDDAGAADQPERRLDPDDAVGAGRAHDRPVGLRADRDAGQVRRGRLRPSRCSTRTGCGRARAGCWSARRGRSSRCWSWSTGSSPTRRGSPCRAGSRRRRAASSRGRRRGPVVLPTSANEPAVVCCRSAVSTLSLSSTGTPSSRLRAPCWRRCRSLVWRPSRASGLVSITACSRGLSALIRAR